MTVLSMEELGLLGANVYVVTSDLHKSCRNLANRLNYVKEVKYVEDTINGLAIKLRKEGFTPYRISLGDEFHNSYRQPDSAMADLNSYKEFSKVFKKSFLTLGNHEFTYYNSNPVWHLIKENYSDYLDRCSTNGKVIKSKGSVFTVTDRLVDGDTEFLFNHYGAGVYDASTMKHTVGLFHQDIVFRAALDDAKKTRDLFELDKQVMEKYYKFRYIDGDDVLKNYDECYYGHAHMLYGTWEDDYNTKHTYLASLGRTKVTEVQNNFLERKIPLIYVKDGKYIKTDYFYFNLLPREECVDENKVEIAKIKYNKTKVLKESKNVKSFSDPITNIKSVINEPSQRILDSILNDKIDDYRMSIMEQLRSVKKCQD